MLALLLGPDDFSKKQHISALAKKHKAEVEFFSPEDGRPDLSGFFGQDLFAKPKIIVLRNLLAGYEYNQELAGKLSASKNIIIFQDAKLDKRLSGTKQWLADKHLEIKDFALPHGAELDNWIIKRAKELNGSIGKSAARLLGQKLGRDDAKETKFGGKVVAVEEVYNLWQADSEIQKLIAYAQDREITEADVNQLVSENGEVDVFNLINAIAENRRPEAMDLLARFLKDQNAGDEKGSIIQLNALLSEQFRNVAMVQDFIAHKTSDEKILEASGWKPGRLFVMKKIAGRFKPGKVRDTLNKLSALDDELKTGSTPPKVLLDLILTQLFA
jgi:DNA polymerase III delta subunit